MQKDLLIFGIQGSGKGTQTELLSKYYNTAVFGTGDELRKLAKVDKDLFEIMSRGELVTSHYIKKIIDDFIVNNIDKPIIWESTVRSEENRKIFLDVIEKYDRKFIPILYDLDIDTAIERCMKRAEIEGRYDDTLDLINHRISWSIKQMMPIAKSFGSKLLILDASLSPEEIFENTLHMIDNYDDNETLDNYKNVQNSYYTGI